MGCQGNAQFEEKQLLNTSSLINDIETTGFAKSKGIWEIINNDLKDYSSVQLLNDFNFILQEFGNRDKFLDLYHYILGKDKEAPSVLPDKSLILMRNMHDKVFYAKYDEQRKLL